MASDGPSGSLACWPPVASRHRLLGTTRGGVVLGDQLGCVPPRRGTALLTPGQSVDGPAGAYCSACLYQACRIQSLLEEYAPAGPSTDCPVLATGSPPRWRRSRSWSPSTTPRGLAEQAVVTGNGRQHASDRSAHLEAISHVTMGIELLTTLPETPAHTQQALTLYIGPRRGPAETKGMPRPRWNMPTPSTRVVSAGGRDTTAWPGPDWSLAGLFVTITVAYGTRARGSLTEPGATRVDPALSVVAPFCPRVDVVLLGVLPVARRHLEEGIARYTPDQCVRWCSAWPRSRCYLPTLCCVDSLVTGVPGASPGPPSRYSGVGTRAGASF